MVLMILLCWETWFVWFSWSLSLQVLALIYHEFWYRVWFHFGTPLASNSMFWGPSCFDDFRFFVYVFWIIKWTQSYDLDLPFFSFCSHIGFLCYFDIICDHLLMSFWHHLGSIWEPFWHHFRILPGHISILILISYIFYPAYILCIT